MKVDNPRFGIAGRGEVILCCDCPLDIDTNEENDLCREWWKREDSKHLTCPTSVNYQEAVSLAEQANKGE